MLAPKDPLGQGKKMFISSLSETADLFLWYDHINITIDINLWTRNKRGSSRRFKSRGRLLSWISHMEITNDVAVVHSFWPHARNIESDPAYPYQLSN